LKIKISVSSVCTGAQAGTIVAMAVCGALASSSIGWPSIFYIFGAMGILWAVLWFFLGADRPGTHKYISKEEQAYIETNLGSIVSTDTVCGNSHLYDTCKAPTANIWQD
jgi:MFS family permease